MSEKSLVSLPHDIIFHILSHLSQSELAIIACASSQLYDIATNLLYHTILVIPEVLVSGLYSYNVSKFVGSARNITCCSYVRTINHAAKLLEVLKAKPCLTKKIVHFQVQKEHSSNSRVDGVYVQLGKVLLQEKSGSTTSMECSDLYVQYTLEGQFHVHDRTIRVGKLSDVLLVDETHLNHLILDVKGSDMTSVDVTALLSTIESLEIRNLDIQGLDTLKRIHGKLSPNHLTIAHGHEISVGDLEESETDDTDEGTKPIELSEKFKMPSPLDFSILESHVDVSGLSSLRLQVSCGDDIETADTCGCFEQFMHGFQKYLQMSGGLPNLHDLEICILPQGEWVQPHYLLDAILMPVSCAVATLTHLNRFGFSLSLSTLKMYEESGMTPHQLNRVNCGLVEAFFLALSPLLKSLTHLELPDFLMGFFFYKPNFMESLLHVCPCDGCGQMLLYLSKHVPVDEDGHQFDRNSALYVMVGFILDKLQEERHLIVPPNKNKKVQASHCALYKGSPRRLEQVLNFSTPHCGVENSQDDLKQDLNGQATMEGSVLHTELVLAGDISFLQIDDNITISDLDHLGRFYAAGEETNASSCMLVENNAGGTGVTALQSKQCEFDIDNLVTTYILHQVRPVVTFLEKMFLNLSLLMVHGLHFEKEDTLFVSVFDEETYPDMGGATVPESGFGRFVFLNE